MAWKYGPVVQSVYDEFQHFKDNPITKFAKNSTGNVIIADEKSSPILANILNEVWCKYKKYSGIELSRFTCQKGTAWYKAVKNKKQSLSYNDIKAEKEYF